MADMKNNNASLIEEGFRETLAVLVPYVVSELQQEYHESWWSQGVYSKLYPDQQQLYPAEGTDEELSKLFDIKLALKSIDLNWNNVFRKKFSKACRSWVNEVDDFRNRWAHQKNGETFSDSDTARVLEDLSLICKEMNESDVQIRLDEKVRILRYGNAQGSIHAQPENPVSPQTVTRLPSGLKPWREVMAPHKDVADGLYRNTKFAADLSQVVSGKASMEYRDPVEFFNRTFLTEGMSSLMKQALLRVSGQGGDPIVELKTAFGGGKTHTMLALYHMLHESGILARVPSLAKVVQSAGLDDIPLTHVAVFVGTAKGPTTIRRPADMPGVQINTMWGDIAYQLAKSCNNPNLYDLVKEADKKGVNPGSEALQTLFVQAGPCLILIDELVAYGRILPGRDDLPAGTFDNFITFIQSLTEAVKASPTTILVVSIPESDEEIGDDNGKKTLNALNRYFGRMQSIWKPVAPMEGFEIVRRRLFSQCVDEAARDETCEAFGKMYREHSTEFPVECKEEDYIKRMKACYPIHPEVFERLYDDWATLEMFQRTRGVLRLMAGVISKLWENGDMNPMIMPASLPLSSGAVKEELLRYLSPEWNSIVDLEVDGPKSQPVQIDKNDPSLGRYQAARKVARTLFFGSAPSKGQQNRGLEKSRLMLGCVQPGESTTVYTNALAVLLTRLSYLYHVNMDHFWYDTRPTLRKLMEDRANRITDDSANDEITKRLYLLSQGYMFNEIHVAPQSSMDIPELESARLVILAPTVSYTPNESNDHNALEVVSDFLQNHGKAPRQFKNTLIFCFADGKQLHQLRMETKKYLAWKSIDEEKESQDYTKADLLTIQEGMARSKELVTNKINDTYCWVVVPRSNGLKDINLSPVQYGGSDPVIIRIEKQMEQKEDVVRTYSPALLVMLLDKYYWKDRNEVQVKDLWNAFCSYCYLPRLTSWQVLENSIVRGVEGDEYFGIAEGVSDDVYLGLKFNEPVGQVDRSSFIVKREVAQKQKAQKSAQTKLEQEDDLFTPEPSSSPSVVSVPPVIGPFGGPVSHPVGGDNQPTPRSFFLSTKLDKSRATRDFGRLMDEVVSQIIDVQGAKCTIKVEVSAEFPLGKLTSDKRRVIEENCRTLQVDESSFE